MLNFTVPGFSPKVPDAPEPPAPPPEPPKEVDAARILANRRRSQQRASNIRNEGGSAGQALGGNLQTALKALTGQ